MTITCNCGQSWTMAQWPAGHYTVICSCGKTLLSRDGTGVHLAKALPPPEPPKPEYAIGVDPAAPPPRSRGKHGRAA